MNAFNLNRFLVAQETNYQKALYEIKSGRKTTYCIWSISPQVYGLGSSEKSHIYATDFFEDILMKYYGNTKSKKTLNFIQEIKSNFER